MQGSQDRIAFAFLLIEKYDIKFVFFSKVTLELLRSAEATTRF